jgi:hypothetical protein
MLASRMSSSRRLVPLMEDQSPWLYVAIPVHHIDNSDRACSVAVLASPMLSAQHLWDRSRDLSWQLCAKVDDAQLDDPAFQRQVLS